MRVSWVDESLLSDATRSHLTTMRPRASFSVSTVVRRLVASRRNHGWHGEPDLARAVRRALREHDGVEERHVRG